MARIVGLTFPVEFPIKSENGGNETANEISEKADAEKAVTETKSDKKAGK